MNTWVALSEGKFRKPILRVGQFEKRSDGTRFEFTQEHLNYFEKSFSNKVPVPLEHTSDPEANRGWVTDMKVENDVLYGVFEFEGLEHPNRYDTSVNIPIEDGRVQPINHVALTSYPVVDGLGKFEAIACSLLPIGEKKESSVAVNWANLRTTLELSEDLTEENVVEVLTKRFGDMSKKIKDLELSNAPKIKLEDVKKTHPQLLKLAKDGRAAKIRTLPLSKAAQDKLEAAFCSDDSLELSLSSPAGSSIDIFDLVFEAISAHEPLEEGEISGIQLSDGKKGQESYLIADAKARAERAKK